jgi:hypothetical protein
LGIKRLFWGTIKIVSRHKKRCANAQNGQVESIDNSKIYIGYGLECRIRYFFVQKCRIVVRNLQNLPSAKMISAQCIKYQL